MDKRMMIRQAIVNKLVSITSRCNSTRDVECKVTYIVYILCMHFPVYMYVFRSWFCA